MILKQGTSTSFTISYNIGTEDGKIPGDIQAAKFFLSTHPAVADDKYLLKSFGAGSLEYDSGTWTVTLDHADLDLAAARGGFFKGVLAIQYTGDAGFREPTLTEGGDPFWIQVESKQSDS